MGMSSLCYIVISSCCWNICSLQPRTSCFLRRKLNATRYQRKLFVLPCQTGERLFSNRWVPVQQKCYMLFKNRQNNNIIWKQEVPFTSAVKCLLLALAFGFFLHSSTVLTNFFPLVVSVPYYFLLSPFFLGMGLFMGGFFFIFTVFGILMLSVTSLSLFLPVFLPLSVVLILLRSRRVRNSQTAATTDKNKMESTVSTERRDDWFEIVYRKTQDDLERFDSRLRMKTKPVDIKFWTIDDIVDELETAGLGEYACHFREHRIDGRILSQLNETNLKEDLKVEKLGDRKRMIALFRLEDKGHAH